MPMTHKERSTQLLGLLGCVFLQTLVVGRCLPPLLFILFYYIIICVNLRVLANPIISRVGWIISSLLLDSNLGVQSNFLILSPNHLICTHPIIFYLVSTQLSEHYSTSYIHQLWPVGKPYQWPHHTSSIWKERMSMTHGKGHTKHVSNIKLKPNHSWITYIPVYLDIWYEKPQITSHETIYVKTLILAMERVLDSKPLLICTSNLLFKPVSTIKLWKFCYFSHLKWPVHLSTSRRPTSPSSQTLSCPAFYTLQDALEEDLEPTPYNMSGKQVSFQHNSIYWFSFALGSQTR